MNILIDDIKQFKEFTIRGCKEVSSKRSKFRFKTENRVLYFDFFSSPKCAFSNGGNLFAAVHGNVIQIYSTTTFENVANLKGHNGKVILRLRLFNFK